MKIFYCLAILLFSANLSYAADETNKIETEEKESSIAPKDYILNLDNKQDDILIDENLLVDQQDIESEDFARLLPDKNFEEDKNVNLQEEEDIEVFNLESQKNNQKERSYNNTLSNKNLLPKVQQSPDASITNKSDKGDEDDKVPKKHNDTSHDLSRDEIKDFNKENAELLKFPQWEGLFKDEITKWKYKKTPNITIYSKLSENNNNHLPRVVYLQDYSKQIYYCIVKDDLSSFRAIINKLEDIGMTINDVFTLKPDSVHDLLTFAMKTGKRDIVDFLLYKGAVFSTNNSDELLSAAIQYGYFDLADSIKKIRNSSFKEINNDLNSDMYKWATEVKYNNVDKQ